MKKITLFFCLVVFVFLFFVIINPYQIKIELEIENKNVIEIDKNIAQKIEYQILQIPEIQDVITFSFDYGCEIFCKIKPFVFDKTNVISIIQRQIEPILNDFDCIENVRFIEKYTPKNDFNDFEQKADYIYFSSSDLLNYDLSLEDLKNIIQDNNLEKNFFYENGVYFDINTNLKNIDDIKRIILPYKNSRFSLFFEDVFEIKSEPKKSFKSEILKRSEIFKNKYFLSDNLEEKNENIETLIPKKERIVRYEILTDKLNEYKLSQKNVTDSILVNTTGLKVAHYFDGLNKINVYLKSKDKSKFIYSKNLKILIPFDDIVKSDLYFQYTQIARKNGKYMILYKSKNPSN